MTSLHRTLLFTLLATLTLSTAGCELTSGLLDQLGVRVGMRGDVALSGDVPAEQVQLNFKLYRYLDNTQALDTSGCPEGTGLTNAALGELPECFGHLDVDALTTLVPDVTVNWSPGSPTFSLTNVPADAAYILVVDASAPNAQCGTDVIGYDSQSKLVERDDVISLFSSAGATTTFDLPRPVQISCGPVEETDPDDLVPDDDDRELPDPTNPAWTQFELRDKGGAVLADASSGPVPGADDRAPCGDSVPLDIWAAIEDFDGAQAYIHIQEGRDAGAVIRDQIAHVSNGRVEAQSIQISGGYARIQIDTQPIETTDFSGASHTIEVCSPDEAFDWPRQELLTVVSWNTDDTDVDTHVWTGQGEPHDHVWYARLRGAHGELDLDDINGYGPETFTSNQGVSGLTYDVKLHYYSDHGHSSPPTNVSVRVIYADEEAGVFCDLTRVVPDLRDNEWKSVGRFGPELSSMATQDPERFTALGCIQP